ncbi:MAG: tRNA (adenosine(37)-N6)-dimethylallyltransferase MiaA [Muribaculaceae bacterium]|nr:tRNA (adenosine(37)-N6)-dimethylallyltransferase MiaA [Muribaculaceae bacterium]MDE6510459.1 tRNA (adenosine(37)-N6)-dimethylallyltransferase MiaA [Muribaculaceae bacterium]
MSAFTLIVVAGATASGKTAAAIDLAGRLGCEIISADSRQIYRDIPITTAQPTAAELAAVTHHFVGILPLDAYYSASQYEADVLSLIGRMKDAGQTCAVMAGGSMMYIDAVVRGLDDLPSISDDVRAEVLRLYETRGLDHIRAELARLDPEYLAQADPMNHRRLIHALEIIIQSGRKFSSLRTGAVRQRPFSVVKLAIDMPRDQLFSRINRRVESMIDAGMEREARAVSHLRHLNSLNTVGFKEMFAAIDGQMTIPEAIARIQKNTRVYAKKQLTWLRRDPGVTWLPEATFSADAATILQERLPSL